MANLTPYLRQRFVDSTGAALNGGKLYSYEAGTTTLKATYTDYLGTTANANPVILDSEGYADVWINAGAYKFILTDSADVTIWTVDNITQLGVGTAGTSFLTGSGVPGAGLGNDGDKYLDTDDGQIYAKAAGAWAVDSNLDTYLAAYIATQDTDDIAEGTNLYYTQARFDSALTAKDTGDLSEGSNLYYTDGRADARIALANLNDLADITETTPVNDQVLTYSAGGWINKNAAGGGGGGIEVEWFTQNDAPIESIANNSEQYAFEDALTQYLYCEIRVPDTYSAGDQINLKGNFFSALTSGDALFTAVSTLIRTGTDATDSTTNQHTSTNVAVTVNGTANVETAIDLDLTDGSGDINSVAVSAGDRIKIRLTRDTGTDTAAGDVNIFRKGYEVTL